MSGDHNRETDPGNYQRRTFMALLSALGATGLAGCGDDGDGDTPTDTEGGNGNGNGNGNGDTPSDEPTPTDTPRGTAPPPQDVTPRSYDRPGDANVVFGQGVDGFANMTQSPPDIGITEVTDWDLADDGSYMQVVQDTTNIWTRDALGDCHLHVEWKPPDNAGEADGQNSSNSGIFMMDAYEVQVLNNDNNNTYGGGYASSLYLDAPPMVDPARPPTEWQAYDIVWRGPTFNDDDEVVSPATATVFFNGVCVLPHINVLGPNFGGVSPYDPHPEEVAVRFQDHPGISEVQYRNIWYQTTPPQSATDGVSQFREQYETFEAGTSGAGFISQKFSADFPEGYRVEGEDSDVDYQPPAVSPGDAPDQQPADGNLSYAPADATTLLEGGDLSGWVASGGGDPGWSEEGEYVAVEPGSGNISTEETFADAQVHLEFRLPEDADSPDSGILLADRYEINIAGSGTSAQGCGAYTGQAAPLRDATDAANEDGWHGMDIVWQGPRFEGGAVLNRPGRVSVLLNGQVVQDRLYLDGPNAGGEVGNYSPHDAAAPITLQENGSPVEFRYVWARSLYPEEGGR